MTLLQRFIFQYQEESSKNSTASQMSSMGVLDYAIHTLSGEQFLPSDVLKQTLSSVKQRAQNPINIAIVGQFSAGKSTFLNAILSQAILPTGVTPVTSKVCRIGYGQEFALKVLYDNAESQWHAIEDIFHLEDTVDKTIKEFHLKAPISFLKDINFLDTPGFNSQRESDTQTTQEILESVDGIIWLTLIDNAGKQSELEILEKFMHRYAHKSLCVLNQKDRLSDANEIEVALNYVRDRFNRFFADVIPVSSLMALRSKGFDKESITAQAISNFSRKITHLNAQTFTQEAIQALFKESESEIHQLSISNSQDAHNLYQESNFAAVMDFINDHIRPKANQAKEFSLKQEMDRILNILIEQYLYLEEVLLELQQILDEYNQANGELLQTLKSKHKKELHALAQEFHYHIEDIAESIFSHIQKKDKDFFDKQKGFLGEKFVKYPLSVPQLDLDRINEELFLGDSKNIKFFKNFQIKIKKASSHLQKTLDQYHDDFANKIELWQERSEFIQKQQPLMSDDLFENFKHYTFKVYQDVTEGFLKSKAEMQHYIHMELDGLNILFGGIHIKLTELILLAIEKRIHTSVELHLNDPKSFKVFMPSFEEIKTIIEESFCITSYLLKIEGEESVADRLYQKIYIAYDHLFVDKKQQIVERIAKLQERRAEIEALKKHIEDRELL